MITKERMRSTHVNNAARSDSNTTLTICCESVGLSVGESVGLSVGESVGLLVGESVGLAVGESVCFIPFAQNYRTIQKQKRSVINSRQHHSKKRVNQANQILTSCSIPFAQYLKHDPKRKARRSICVSITARNESIRQSKYLPSGPFHSHSINRMIQ